MLLHITFMSAPPNSKRTCLHMPQGYMKSSKSLAIVIAIIFLSPSETALKTAVRSAQFVAP